MNSIKPVKKPKIVRLDLFTIAIISLMIIFGVFLAGGLMPKNFKVTKYSDNQKYTPANPDAKADSAQGLQLNLIKLKGCSSTAAVNFLVDRSGSMGFDGGKKIKNLRNALLSFKNKLSDDNIFGLQIYSDDSANRSCNNQGKPWCNIVDPDYYKNVKNGLKNKICAVQPNGGTYTRDAFLETEKVLDEAIKKFPNYKFALIFISDGIPEDATNIECPGGIGGAWCGANENGGCRCYSQKQDPTNFYDSSKVDIPKRIKDKGVRIFSISYIDKTDEHLNNLLQGLMERIASSKDDYYSAPDETKIKEILDQIAVKICQEG